MSRKIRRLRWVVSISVMLVLLGSVSIVYGGGRFSGIDPVLIVNDDQVNIWVEWPTERTCDVMDIDVSALVPLFADAQLIAESAEKFRCDDGRKIEIQTNTEITHATVAVANISAVVRSPGVFPVRLIVSLNGEEKRVCEGLSNLLIECVPFSASNLNLLNKLLFF